MKHNYKKNKLEQLKGFCAVVENKNSINDAAAKSNISATTISKQISSLEDDLGIKLFDRIKNRLILNENGKKYYKEAKKVLLDLDKIYNGKIGVNKFSTKEILKNKLQKIFLRIKQFLLRNISRMIIKVRFTTFVKIIIITTITILICYEKKVRSEFVERIKSITQNISKNINDIDYMMGQNLRKTLIYWSEGVKNNKYLTMPEIVDLTQILSVSELTIWDKNGKLELNSAGTHLPGGLFYDKYSKDFYSIFDKGCPPINMNLRDTITIFPLFKTNRGKVPIKTARIFESKTKRYLEAEYNNNNVGDLLNSSMNLHNDIIFIGLSGPMKTEIISFKNDKYSNFVDYKQYDRYLSIQNIDKKPSSYIISQPFGGLQQEVCLQKKSNRTNINGEYFYVLTTEFTTTSLKHHLWTVRIVTILSLSTFLSLIYLWNKTRIEKIERSKKRKNGRWHA